MCKPYTGTICLDFFIMKTVCAFCFIMKAVCAFCFIMKTVCAFCFIMKTVCASLIYIEVDKIFFTNFEIGIKRFFHL